MIRRTINWPLDFVANWYEGMEGWRRRLLALIALPIVLVGLVAATARAFRNGLTGKG
jgi:hypothetical protein